MVQIIRPQMRNYQADQTAAIKQQQMTQNISEVAGVVQGVANIYNAYQKGAKAEQKQAEEAETKVISTEIGSKAANEVLRFNVENIEKGQDVSTPEYQNVLEQEARKKYQPYIDSLNTEKGKDFLREQLRTTVDSINRSNIGRIGKLQKSAQAQQAAQGLTTTLQTDAFEFGKIGDWESFADESAASREALVDYKESQGTPREVAEAEVDFESAKNYYLGLAVSDPVEILTFFADQDDPALEKNNPYIQDEYEKLKKRFPESDDERMRSMARGMIYKGSYPKRFKATETLQGFASLYKDEYIKMLEAQKQTAEEEQKNYPKGSPNYRSAQDRIDEINEQLSKPEEQIEKDLRGMIAELVMPVAIEEYKKQKREKIEQEVQNTKKLFISSLSPDVLESTNANLVLREASKGDLEGLFEEARGAFPRSAKETPLEEVWGAYARYNSAKQERAKSNISMKDTFEATESTVEGMKKLFAKDGRSDFEVFTDAYELLAKEIGNTEYSDSQEDTLHRLVYLGVRDRVFGGLISDIFNNSDMYYPNLSFMEKYWLPDPKDTAGVITSVKYASNVDIDTTKDYIAAQLNTVYQKVFTMIAEAAEMPRSQQEQAMKDIESFIVDSKRQIYDTVVSNYGVNLKKLREQKDKKGYAYTEFGGVRYEYKGQQDDGTPLFDPVDTKEEQLRLRQLIADALSAQKKKDNNE